MAETRQTAAETDYGRSAPGADEPTGWVGWIIYAGLMLILLGSFQAIAGLVAIFDDSYYKVSNSSLVLNVSYAGYGTVHLILGGLAVLAGFGVMSGKTWARVYALVIAMLSAIVNIGFLNAYPIWAVLMIAVDFLVIWALAVHGGEMRSLE